MIKTHLDSHQPNQMSPGLFRVCPDGQTQGHTFKITEPGRDCFGLVMTSDFW